MKESNEDKCLDYNPRKRYTDEELAEIISSFVAINSLHKLDLEARNKVLKILKKLLELVIGNYQEYLILEEGY